MPAVTRIAVLTYPGNPGWAVVLKRLEVAASTLRVKLQVIEPRDPAR